MADQEQNKSLDIHEDEFNKSSDRQSPPSSGVGVGVDFVESLPGGGSDNNDSSITAGDESDSKFDTKTNDDERS